MRFPILILLLTNSFVLQLNAFSAFPYPSCDVASQAQNIIGTEGNFPSNFQKVSLILMPFMGQYFSEKNMCCDNQGEMVGAIMPNMVGVGEYFQRTQGTNYQGGPAPFFGYNPSSSQIEVMEYDPSNPEYFKFVLVYGPYYQVPFLCSVFDATLCLNMWLVGTVSAYDEGQAYYDNLQTWQTLFAAPCGCGYYYSINPSDSSASTGSCVDLNECENGYNDCDSTANSHCVNIPGSFKCECNDGYIMIDNQCMLATNTVETFVTPSSTSAKFHVAITLPESSWSFQYNITDWTNPTYPLPVYGATNIQVTQSLAQNGVQLGNLNPGTRYKITWNVLDQNSNVVTNPQYFSGTFFETLCTCGMATDAPILNNESVTQRDGYVLFEFLGNSMCGDAYTFTRQEKDSDGNYSSSVVFTPNYFYNSGQDCSSIPFTPGKVSADNLHDSHLVVGNTYRYNIRAVGNNYLGDVSSLDYVIRWESSISGFIGLDPSAGNLPVTGVEVQWQLYDLSNNVAAQGVTNTSANGEFTIVFNELVPFTNDDVYPLHLTFSKTTVINSTKLIEHQFLCNNGHVNCTQSGLTVHLQHLDFNVPVNVVDATGIPVSGKVYIANTHLNPNGEPWGEEGCPLMNVQVCLTDKSPGGNNKQYGCVKTAADGRYSVPGVIGSKVSIEATYNSHTFEYVPVGAGFDLEDGFLIEASGLYEQNNFQDTTTSWLSITVAGGLCDILLGDSSLLTQVNGCLWGGNAFTMDAVTNMYNLPAHDLQISVTSIAKRPDIDLGSQNIDLTHIRNQTNVNNTASMMSMSPHATENQTNTSTSDIKALRFQYDGHAVITAVFENNMLLQNCSSVTPPSGGNGLFVLPFQTPTNATFFVVRDLGAGLTCDDVDPSTRLQIQNNIGLISGDPADEAYRTELLQSYPASLISLMSHCNTGCLVQIIQDYDPILKRNTRSRVEFPFMTGRPSIDEPYTKLLTVQTDETNSMTYKAEVVVVGQYKVSDLFSVGLPTYEPILIIRDPPGGGSSSSYQNIQTTLRLENMDFTEFTGMQSDNAIDAGFELKESVCAGLGVAECTQILDSKTKFGVHLKATNVNLDSMKQYVYSGGFTTTWSYTTSTNPMFVGNQSDVFVIPNLNVQYSLTDIVRWNASTCAAAFSKETTFNLHNPGNVPALAFVTTYDIENIEIESLQTIIPDLEQQIREATVPEKQEELKQSLSAAIDGLQGWQQALQINNLTKEMARNGSSLLVRPDEWFQKIASSTFDGNRSISTSGMTHGSSFVSKQLAANAVVRSHYTGSSAANLNSLNTISFSGGGTTLSYQLNQQKITQIMSALGGTSDNSQYNSYVGATISEELVAAALLIDEKVDTGKYITGTHTHIQTDEEESTTSIGFTLSDPDIGDVFDVDVYIDPRYGTFVFHTRSGRSMCPSEPGTVVRAQPMLEVVTAAPVTVLDDELMVFELVLINNGISPTSFMLDINNDEDIGGLGISPIMPRKYNVIEPRQNITTTVTIARGPVLYEYPALEVTLTVGCEFGEGDVLLADGGPRRASVSLYNQIDERANQKLVFARPCPAVFLAGDTARTNTFAVTTMTNSDGIVDITVRNPAAPYMRLFNASQNPATRLEHVLLQYRQTGTSEWHTGQRMVGGNLVDIDFAASGLEDPYGYVTLGWDLGSMSNGLYEFQVQSICENVNGAPETFNAYTTPVIQGVVDRSTPKLFGLPMPQERLPIGQDIVFNYDEELDCTPPFLFDVNIHVSGIDTVFDNDNMLIVCEDRSIAVTFDQSSIDLNMLVDRQLSLNLTNVMDRNGNPAKENIFYTSQIVSTMNPTSTTTHDRQRRTLVNEDDNENLRETSFKLEARLEEMMYEMHRIEEQHYADMMRIVIVFLGFVSFVSAMVLFYYFHNRVNQNAEKYCYETA